jgi:hypothetical protein
MRESPMLNCTCQDYYAHLSNLTLVTRCSRRAISKALEVGLNTSQIEKSSYLILSLCFKEYSDATNLAVRLFGTEEFDTISYYYNRLAAEHPDRHLLIFSGQEIQSILEQVGACIRSSCGTEGIYRTTLNDDK